MEKQEMAMGFVPPTAVGKIVIAVIAAPIVAKNFGPVVKWVGRKVREAGDLLERLADEANEQKARKDPPQTEETAGKGTPDDDAAPNGDVSNKTTKVDAEAAGTKVTTASPTGHEEMERQNAVEAMGDGAVTKPAPPASRKEKKKLEPEQKLNPKRQKNSQAK